MMDERIVKALENLLANLAVEVTRGIKHQNDEDEARDK